jgi:hypothetical protein
LLLSAGGTEDERGRKMALVRWFARPGAVWGPDGPEADEDAGPVLPVSAGLEPVLVLPDLVVVVDFRVVASGMGDWICSPLPFPLPGEKVGIITRLYEDERGRKMALVRWFARPGAVWGFQTSSSSSTSESSPPAWATGSARRFPFPFFDCCLCCLCAHHRSRVDRVQGRRHGHHRPHAQTWPEVPSTSESSPPAWATGSARRFPFPFFDCCFFFFCTK